uniref:Uncharacterized protein n=1 Tax=Oryza glumipatula TaxID=40148 RepID=A0A0D9YPQ3_9ORYZ
MYALDSTRTQKKAALLAVCSHLLARAGLEDDGGLAEVVVLKLPIHVSSSSIVAVVAYVEQVQGFPPWRRRSNITWDTSRQPELLNGSWIII